MRIALVVGVIMFGSLALAGEVINGKDKKDQYDIILKDSVIGKITVSAKYTGEPMMEGTTIRVDIKCLHGYQLNTKFKKPNEFQAYDYGASGKLSEWNPSTKLLKIFHRSGSVDDDNQPQVDESLTMDIDLKDACVRK